MIPHKSKVFRCILDLSFQFQHNGVVHDLVNMHTWQLAKQEAMPHLGTCVKKIVHQMEHEWDGLLFYFAKLDVKDGFWQMAVSGDNAWNFCYILPSINESDDMDNIELVVPNNLQMGWSESPPY